MSQRGGDVQSNLRLSDAPIASDLIALGTADMIISLEPMEAALVFLKCVAKVQLFFKPAIPEERKLHFSLQKRLFTLFYPL